MAHINPGPSAGDGPQNPRRGPLEEALAELDAVIGIHKYVVRTGTRVRLKRTICNNRSTSSRLHRRKFVLNFGPGSSQCGGKGP